MRLSSRPEVAVRLLGPVDVRTPSGDVQVGGRQQQALLALLAMSLGRVVPSDILIDQAWGGRPPPTASAALRVHIARLRRMLMDVADGHDPVPYRTGGYLLSAERITTDVSELADLTREVERAASGEDWASALSLLQQALALWRGQPFAGLHAIERLAYEADRLQELRLHLQEDLVQARLALGQHEATCADIQLLVDEEPLRERRTELFMLALYRTGRQADALAASMRLRRRLIDELGVDPCPEVQRLEGAILRQDAHLAWSPSRTEAPVPGPVHSAAGVVVSPVLQAWVAERTSGLSPDCLHVLRLIAMGDRWVSVAVLAAASERSIESVRALLADAGALLRALGPEETPRFVHDALPAALLAPLDARAHRRVHAELASALDVVHGSAALQAVAWHLLAAIPEAPVEAAGRFVVRAADSCLQARDADMAGQLCEAALALLPVGAAPSPLRVDLLVRLARAQAQQGATGRAEHAWRSALADARTLADPERFALVVLAHDWGRRTVLADSGERDLLSEALQRLAPGPSALRVRLAGTLLAEAAVPGRVRELRDLADEVRQTADAVGDQLAYVTALHAQHVILRASPQVEKRHEVAAELAAAAVRLEDPYWRGVSELAGLFDAFAAGRGAELAPRLQALRREADRAGSARLTWHRLLSEASLHRQAGRFEEADRCAEEAVVHGAAAGIPDALAAGILHRFLVDLATASVVTLLPAIEKFIDGQPANVLAQAALGVAAAHGGDARRALQAGRRVLDSVTAATADEAHLLSLVLTVEAQAHIGRAERLAALRPLLEPYRGQIVVFGQVTGTHGPVDRALALIDLTSGALDSAGALLDSAERISQAAGSPPWTVRCGVDRVRLLRAKGLSRAADALADELRVNAIQLRLGPCIAELAPGIGR